MLYSDAEHGPLEWTASEVQFGAGTHIDPPKLHLRKRSIQGGPAPQSGVSIHCDMRKCSMAGFSRLSLDFSECFISFDQSSEAKLRSQCNLEVRHLKQSFRTNNAASLQLSSVVIGHHPLLQHRECKFHLRHRDGYIPPPAVAGAKVTDHQSGDGSFTCGDDGHSSGFTRQRSLRWSVQIRRFEAGFQGEHHHESRSIPDSAALTT